MTDEITEEESSVQEETPEEVEIRQVQEAREAFESIETPAAEEVPEAQKVFEALKSSEPEEVPKTLEAREAVKAPETKEVSTVSDEQEAQELKEAQEAQGIHLNPVPDDDIVRRWYALHAHSGQEANVKMMLTTGAEALGLTHLIPNVLVPMETVEEMRAGEKKESTRKFFPGYVLLQLPYHPENYPELWELIKETPGVTGFIGSRTLPIPLEEEEVNAIVEVTRGERERPRPDVAFESGERVKIIDGPFANFLGNVNDINYDAGTMKVTVEIFERLTSIEVEFWQVEQV